MNISTRGEIEVPDAVIQAALTEQRVDEAPHSFYRYPARFSPLFAREAIRAFSKAGDTVLDPFCGGGTSVVEAILHGRRAVGFDISTLATFLARAKTSPISVHDRNDIEAWSSTLPGQLDSAHPASKDCAEVDSYYERNLPLRFRIFFRMVIAHVGELRKKRQQQFVRMVLLGVGQWALDFENDGPSLLEFRERFLSDLHAITDLQAGYLKRVATTNHISRCRISSLRRIINRTSEECDQEGRIPDSWLPAKLILTSPPYPGVHVLYHRWQIRSRKETPAPFWISGSQDGDGASHYCLGDRKEPELKTYYSRLGGAFSAAHELAAPDTTVVQLVAFPEPEWQLPAYLEQMNKAGFAELRPLCGKEFLSEGRIWRRVPNRKWYAKNKGELGASKEVLLFHRPA